MTRHLLITRRRIPLDRFDDYARLWNAVRTAAASTMARAWIFEAERSGDRFIEFVEWQAAEDSSLTENAEVAAALDELNAAFHPEDSETWLETKI